MSFRNVAIALTVASLAALPAAGQALVAGAGIDWSGSRDLRALSLSHIDKSLAKGGMGGVVELIRGDLAAKAAAFKAGVAPGLTAQLEAALR